MEFKYVILASMVLSAVFCFPGKSRDKEDSEEERNLPARIVSQMRRNIAESRRYLDSKIDELKDTWDATIGVQLVHIKNVVESIERRQKKAEFCTEGICGANGTCALSDDEDTYACHCQEGYVGEHCEITGNCNVELYLLEQEPPLLGREFPRCDEDGYYAGMQFIGTQAYCVTRDYVEIHGYSVNRWETGEDMNCQCARDEYMNAEGERFFNCTENGNYPQVACNAEWCWCQNWQGVQYGGRVPAGDLDAQLHC